VETDVMTVWNTLLQASGASLEPTLAPLREGELERSCMDPSRAREELGWQTQVTLEHGLCETYEALINEFRRAE
jgi:UDP-glucose 4-epimerase